MNGTPTKRAMVVTGVNNSDTGKWMFDEIRVVMPDGDPGHYTATVIENESPFEDMPPITPDEAHANAALWAEASTVYAETGLTPQELFQLVPPAMLAHCIHYKAAKGGAV